MADTPFPSAPKTPPAKVTAHAEQRRFGALIASRAHRKAILMGIGALLVIPLLMGAGALLVDVPVLKFVVRFLFCFGPVMMLVIAIKTFTVRPHTYLYEGGLVTNDGSKFPIVTAWEGIGELEPVTPRGTTAQPGEEVWGYRTKTAEGKLLAWPTGDPAEDVFLRELLARAAAARGGQVPPGQAPYQPPTA